MNVLFLSPNDAAPYLVALRRHLPEANVLVWGTDDIDKAAIDYACVWNPEPGVLATLPNLKGIFNLGAGVDALLQDKSLPRHIPLVRLVDPMLSAGMVEYVVHWVLHFHRDLHVYARQQAAKAWIQHDNANTKTRRVAILGLGELGQNCAHALLMLGFENVSGWSRSHKELPGLKTYAGQDGLEAFLKDTEILVNLLPSTDTTQGIVDAGLLENLPEGSFFINAGRGATVNDDDLVAALKSNQLSAAALDVFNEEPLPPDHPYWTMDNVFITPHIASLTTPVSASEVAAKALRDLEDGKTPDNLVDFGLGY